MELIYKTGKSIVTLKLSNKNSQFISNNSESIQLNKKIETGDSDNITSKKAMVAKIEDNNRQKVVNICEPVIPIFLPNKPEIRDPIKGNIIIDKYIMF